MYNKAHEYQIEQFDEYFIAECKKIQAKYPNTRRGVINANDEIGKRLGNKTNFHVTQLPNKDLDKTSSSSSNLYKVAGVVCAVALTIWLIWERFRN